MGIVLLVRHGQASFGAEDYDVLSDVGAGQSRVLGRSMADIPRAGERAPAVLMSGAMRRQQDTARILAEAAGWQGSLDVDERWDEFDHLAVIEAYPELRHDSRSAITAGTIDRREFHEIFEKATARWASAAHDDDYAESFTTFLGRVRDSLAEACRAAGPETTVVVVTSGGVIAAVAAMLVQVGDEPRRLSASWQRLNAVMVNTSVTRVVVGSTGARLLTFNEHAHLSADDVTYR
jgi:broad specificity phosphatase PhoE